MSFEENHKQKERSRIDIELDSFIHDISGVTKKNLGTLDNTINHVTKNILNNHPSDLKNSKKAVLGSDFDSLMDGDDSLFKRNYNKAPKRKESNSNWMEKESILGKKSKNITNIIEKKPSLRDFDFEFDDILKKEEPVIKPVVKKLTRKMGREGSRVLGSNRYIPEENSYKSRRNQPSTKKKTPTKADAWD